jgi:hypothetical protein
MRPSAPPVFVAPQAPSLTIKTSVFPEEGGTVRMPTLAQLLLREKSRILS